MIPYQKIKFLLIKKYLIAIKDDFFMKNKLMKIAITLGTRPEIIKMLPVIRECQKNKGKCKVRLFRF